MLIRFLSLVVLAGGAAAGGQAKEVFDLKVERVRVFRQRFLLFRNQPGDLHIDSQAVTFRSGDGKTSVVIPIQDLREADVADPHSLRFETYEVQKWRPIERRQYIFRAAPDAPVDEIAQFLAARVPRPVVGHYASPPQFSIPAYHRRVRSGTNGTLEIGEDGIRFASDKPADSRTWLYRDIETIGRPDRFRFRVTTNRETYVVELKSELPEAAYELAWSNVYNLERSTK
jgi:hypothetical protein